MKEELETMTVSSEAHSECEGEGGRPVFLANEHTKYTGHVDRELTDQEQLAWKSFQLWRAAQSVERRDMVYNAIINSEYTSFHLTTHILGAPYAIVDTEPSVLTCIKCVRPYEHAFSLLVAYSYSIWIRSKPSAHIHRILGSTRRTAVFGTFVMTDMMFVYRSSMRLIGRAANDYECRKYGVIEDRERLEQKKALWERYAAYKREWCRRYDYHVYGIRPGENWSLFSACWLPMWTPAYNTVTDYPRRKNPYFVTTTPVRDLCNDNALHTPTPNDLKVPLVQARPEFQYRYFGPIEAAKSTQKPC